MSDQSQSYTPPLLPLGTVLGGRYRLVEALVGVDDKAVSGGWVGVDQQLGERRVVVRIEAGADPDWVSSREAFGNVAAPILDSFPLEKGSAVVWRLPNQAVKWDHESLSREQRASMVVSLYRAISLDTAATSWVSDAGLFSMPTALGARPWVIPAERLGHTPDSARAEDLNALAELTLSLLFGVIDPTDADALARLPTRVFEVLEPWLSDDAEERLAHALTPLELATALGVAETSDRVPVPTAAVSKSASTKNRVASARALAKRVTRRERIAFVVLLVLLALGYLGLFASGSNVESAVVAREPVPERPAIEVATAENAVERTELRPRLSMPPVELTDVTPAAFLRAADDAEVCREAVPEAPVPTLIGCGEPLHPYEPRVHVFRDDEGRVDVIEAYDSVDRPTERRRFSYDERGQLERITTSSFTMVTQQVEHFDLSAGHSTNDLAYIDDASPSCLQWRFELAADGRYERFSCAGRSGSATFVENGVPNYRATTDLGEVSTISWGDDGRRRCGTWENSLGELLAEQCSEYEVAAKERTYRTFRDGKPVSTSTERTEYAPDGRPVGLRNLDEAGAMFRSDAPPGYDYELASTDPLVTRRTTIGLDGEPEAGREGYDTVVTLEDALGNPVLVITERAGQVVPSALGNSYSHVLRSYDAGGRVTSLSYWTPDELSTSSRGVHRYEWDYENGRWPVEERRYDEFGALAATPYNRIIWERDSTGAVSTLRYFVGDALRAIEEIERNEEGRVSRRCAGPRLLGAAVTGVHCLSFEWPSLDTVRVWFTGAESFDFRPLLGYVGGQHEGAGVELVFHEEQVSQMRILLEGDREAGIASGDALWCSSPGVDCLGLSGFWLNGEEPGALARP